MTSLSSRLKTFERNISDARTARQEAANAEAEQREQQATREAAEVKALVLDYIELLRERGMAPLDHYVSEGDPADHYEYAGQVWPAFILPFKEVKYDADNRPTDHQEQILLSSTGTVCHGQGRSSAHYPRRRDGIEYPAEPGVMAAFDLEEYSSRQALMMLTARLPGTKEKSYDKHNLGEQFRTNLFRDLTNPNRPVDRITAAAQYELDQLDEAQRNELAAHNHARQLQETHQQRQADKQQCLDQLVADLDLAVLTARLAVDLAACEDERSVSIDTPVPLHSPKPTCTGNCDEEKAVRNALISYNTDEVTFDLEKGSRGHYFIAKRSW